MISTLAQLLVTGIAMGFIYCLVAIEYTLIWNSTGLVNFAHDKFITLGAYFFGGTMYVLFGNNFVLCVIGTTVAMFLYGVVVSKVIFMPLSKMPTRIYAVTGTLMLSIIMRESIRIIWGPAPFTVPKWLVGTFSMGTIIIPRVNIIIIIISVILLIVQNLFFKKTKLGKGLTCVSQDKEVAALMGIDVNKNIAISVGISSMLCGWIGILVIPLFSINASMSGTIAMKGFSAGVVGGFGTMGGAVVGGLLIGIIENLYVLIGPSTYKDVVSFVILICFLIINPGGIAGLVSKKKKRNVIAIVKDYCLGKEKNNEKNK